MQNPVVDAHFAVTYIDGAINVIVFIFLPSVNNTITIYDDIFVWTHL